MWKIGSRCPLSRKEDITLDFQSIDRQPTAIPKGETTNYFGNPHNRFVKGFLCFPRYYPPVWSKWSKSFVLSFTEYHDSKLSQGPKRTFGQQSNTTMTAAANAQSIQSFRKNWNNFFGFHLKTKFKALPLHFMAFDYFYFHMKDRPPLFVLKGLRFHTLWEGL